MPDRPRPRKLLAIDWDAQRLRIVDATLGRRRGVKVERIVSVGIPADVDGNDPQQLGEVIRRALDQEGISTRHAVVDIPRNQATLNTLKLPVTAPEGLPGIVEIQIAKELPFPLAEAMVDFVVAPHEPGDATAEVLVAAVRRELLTKYEATFTAAGLKLDRIGLRPFANKLAVCALLRHAPPERVLFIDVGPTYTEINVLRNGFLAFSRAASVAAIVTRDEPAMPRFSLVRPDAGDDSIESPDAPDARDDFAAPVTKQAIIQSLVLEVTRSIEAYRAKDPGAKIDHVVIGGDMGIEEALSEAVHARLGIVAEIYNPAGSFGWSPDEGAGAAAYASTLGLVLGYAEEGALEFDFLHPKRIVTTAQKRLRMAPIAAGIVLSFLGAGVLTVRAVTAEDRKLLAELEQKIDKLEANQSKNQTFMKFVEEVRQFDPRQLVWVDELYDLVGLLPPAEELVVNHLEMNQKDRKITLKTRTKKRDTANETLNRMVAFRREGKEHPRFRVSIGAQSEKKAEKYPFIQDLRIEILDDSGPAKNSAKQPDQKGDATQS